MESFWKGTFAKHHLDTGDISNHIEILGYDIEFLGDDIELLDDDMEHDVLGVWVAHVQVGFIESDEVYDYDVEVEGPDVTEEDLRDTILEQILDDIL